jgi:8-oxo-dGTP pyrophosphatase MutT (NUDIX family)
MHRTPLLEKLAAYHPSDDHERVMLRRILDFVREHPDCFERTLLVGHITASALIVNPQRTRTLMTHHQKLDKWLQLGGHADGDPDPMNVALREAEEESGLGTGKVRPVSQAIFDVDVHPIPARKNEPEHYHYDIRFLFEADDTLPLTITAESKDLAWIPLDGIEKYSTEESILRMVRKVIAQ